MPISGISRPFELVLRLDRKMPSCLQDAEENVGRTETPDEDRDRADDLREELAAIAEEQPLRLQSAVVGRSIGKQTERQHAPGTIDAMDGDRADRVVDLADTLEDAHRDTDEHAGDQADDHRADRTDPARWSGDCYEPGEDAVHHVARVPLPHRELAVEHGRDRRSRAGQHRDRGDLADAQVAAAGCAQRAAWVEPEPAEGQDEAADGGHVQVVAGHRVCRAILVVLAEARAKHHGARRAPPSRPWHARRQSRRSPGTPCQDAVWRQAATASHRPRPS